MELSNQFLIQQLKAGHESSFKYVYDLYSTAIYRYLYRLVYEDSEKAEDYLQDVFEKLIENIDKLDENLSLKTWLYTVATNLVKNDFRNTNLRAKLIQKMNVDKFQSHNNEENIDKKNFAKQLNQKMKKLDDNTREIMILRYYQELTVKEISKVVSLPEGTIKSRIFYTLKHLAQELKTFHPKHQ